IPIQFDVMAQGPPMLRFVAIDTTYRLPNFFTATAAVPSLAATPGGLLTIVGEQFEISKHDHTQVLIGGQPADILSLTPARANVQVPSSTPMGLTDIQINRHGVASKRLSLPIAKFAPQILSVADSSGNVVDQYHSIQAGQTIVMTATGLGPTNPTVNDGH